MRELLYNNLPIKINKDNSYIDLIYLIINTNELPENYMWDDFFAFKLLKNIKISMDDHIIFNTNGMIIKSKIDVFNQSYKKKEFGYIYDKQELNDASIKSNKYYIPLFLPTTLPNTQSDILMRIDLNPYLLNKIKISIFIHEFCISSDDHFKSLIKIDQMEIIPIDKNVMNLDYNLKSDGVIEYFLFYIDNNIKVENISIVINDLFKNDYTYADLNALLPFYYLGYQLPKNYMFISFSNNDQDGLCLSRFNSVKLEIKFKKNEGGNIYVMSLNRNVLTLSNNIYKLEFDHKLQHDKYLWNPPILSQHEELNNYDNVTDELITICI